MEGNALSFVDGRPILSECPEGWVCQVKGVEEASRKSLRLIGKNPKIVLQDGSWFLMLEKAYEDQAFPFQEKTPIKEVKEVRYSSDNWGRT